MIFTMSCDNEGAGIIILACYYIPCQRVHLYNIMQKCTACIVELTVAVSVNRGF